MPDSPQQHEPEGAVDALIAEYLAAIDSGEAVDRERFVGAHPNHEDALRRFFENLASIEQLLGAAADPEPPPSDASAPGGDPVEDTGPDERP